MLTQTRERICAQDFTARLRDDHRWSVYAQRVYVRLDAIHIDRDHPGDEA